MEEYTEVCFRCNPPQSEILAALLSDRAFESFQETETGLKAFIPQKNFNKHDVDEVIESVFPDTVTYTYGEVANKNWNEEWEKNYDPIVVENRCLIRASFHKELQRFPYEIVVNPKMSFGTGHHSTTYLMIKAMFDVDFEHKKVLDAGTGTGVLAILAEKFGAKQVLAYDNSPLSVQNALDNAIENNASRIEVQMGEIGDIKTEGYFQIIMANINRNVLLQELNDYAEVLDKQDGKILLSGFFQKDAQNIIRKAREIGLTLKSGYERNSWSALTFSFK